jgi:HEAT repeat protein
MTSHASAEVRHAVADGLAGTAGTDEELRATARTALRSMFEDDVPRVRISAAANLIVLGEEPWRCLPVLESFLAVEDGDTVKAALTAFETVGPRAAPSIPALIAAFQTKARVPAGISSAPLHEIVPHVIAKFGAAAVPALIAALEHADPQVRGHAAGALGLIGPDAGLAAAALASRFQDQTQYFRTNGCIACRQTVAQDALEAVAQIGPQARGALPGIAELIRGQPADTAEKGDLQSAIIDALGAIGPDAADAVPWLWDVATQDDDAWWNAHALVAIARITPDDPRVFEQFNELLLWIPQWDPMLELHGAEASLVVDFLRDSGTRARTLVPTLSHLLCEAPLLSRDFRIRIAIALVQFDPHNAEAIRYLQRQALIGPRGYRLSFHQWYARRILKQLTEEGLLSQPPHD